MMSRGLVPYLVLIFLMSGCAHSPSWLSVKKSASSAAPVTESAIDSPGARQASMLQWDKVFTALAGNKLSTQKQLLNEIASNTSIPVAERDLQRALLLALGEADINNLPSALNLTSKYQVRPQRLSPQARFAILIIENKQADMIRLDALNSKLDALKSIEESMMRRGQE